MLAKYSWLMPPSAYEVSGLDPAFCVGPVREEGMVLDGFSSGRVDGLVPLGGKAVMLGTSES